MKKILVIEDEPAMREGLKDNLEFEGYSVDTAENGVMGLEKIEKKTYDLIISDVMMPVKSGLDVCRDVRNRNIPVGIILLTAKSQEIDKVLGLELGADDYVTKPFSLRELSARIKAVLRRYDSSTPKKDDSKISIGRLLLDFQAYVAKENNEEVHLSHKEFELLKYFIEHPGKTISRDELLEKVWGYEEAPTSRTVDNFMLKLRQKIEHNPSRPRHILTVHGVGYKYVK